MEKYEFQPCPIEDVIENPELYIIPECLEICKIFWSKGIDTTQCSNYNKISEGKTYWVEIDIHTLSDENRKKVYDMYDSESPNINEDMITHNPRFKASRDEKGIELLKEIASSFFIQDSRDYTSDAEILAKYKRHGGEWFIASDGSIRSKNNPERENATIEDALAELDLTYYIKEEGKLFNSKHAYDVHMNYIKELNKNRLRIAKVLKLVREKKEREIE
ncbi:MAG: hypothetical protein IJH20_02825 [Bacilli bacterium]|nr:hypothetical protein [Bacilli bacterium]